MMCVDNSVSEETDRFSKNKYSVKSHPGPSCSKLTMSLVNVSLKFQTLISNICQCF